MTKIIDYSHIHNIGLRIERMRNIKLAKDVIEQLIQECEIYRNDNVWQLLEKMEKITNAN
jgi:hypothetical protein